MGWFSRIFGEPGETPFNSDLPEPDPIDWESVENVLLELSEQALRDFLKKHPEEVFYGFGFDCDVERVQVLLSINSRAELEASVRESAGDDLGSASSLQARMMEQMWDLGTWKYQGFNAPSRRWDVRWAEAEAAVSNCMAIYREMRQHETHAQIQAAFIDTCARVLLRLQDSEPFQAMHKEDGFRIFCAGSSEMPGEEGLARMARLQALAK